MTCLRDAVSLVENGLRAETMRMSASAFGMVMRLEAERIGLAVALLLGGLLSTHSYELAVALSALGPLIVVGVALALPRPSQKLKPAGRTERSYLSLIKGGIRQRPPNSPCSRSASGWAIFTIAG